MNDAKEVVEKIRMDLRPLDEKILGHPYIMALNEGKIPQDSLRTFAGQQYHIITSDLRSIASLLSRHGLAVPPHIVPLNTLPNIPPYIV